MQENTHQDFSADRIMSLAPKVRLKALNFLLRWNRWEDALPIAERLAEDQSDGLLYRSILVKVLAALGEIEQAHDILGELIDKYPHRMSVLSAAGDFEIARDDIPAALVYYLQMVQLNADSPDAWRRLASVYLAAGQLNKAHAYCRKVIERAESKGIDPHPSVMRVLAVIHREKGSLDLADEIELALKEREAREAREESELFNFLENSPNAPVRPASKQVRNEVATVKQPETLAIKNTPVPHLPSDAGRALADVFGHNQFRQGQDETIARILNGENVLVTMPTGSGKSLCYQLPAAMGKRTVVISPLIALMKDQIDGLPDLLAKSATLVNSSIDSDELADRLSGIRDGKYDLIYVAPERLRNRPFLEALHESGIDLFVVDEVHCLSVWGHSFRPDYLQIASTLEMLGNPVFCGMTATANQTTQNEICRQINKPLVGVSTTSYRPNLHFEVRQASNAGEKLRALGIICQSEPGAGIIYANSRKRVEEIAGYLRSLGIDAAHYHAGMDQDERSTVQEAFMDGGTRIIVATIAFGMGVDKPDVRFVVHFSLPKSLENYYQEAGRAGRDGLKSKCILFYTPSDKAMLTTFATSDHMNLDQLKTVYYVLRRLVKNGNGCVSPEELANATQLDDTTSRVAISLLERAGMVRRLMDVPMKASIGITNSSHDDDGLSEFVRSLQLIPGQPAIIDFREISAKTGLALYEIEPILLDWSAKGFIEYSGVGRAMYIELPKAQPGAKSELENILKTLRADSIEKVKLISAYAKTEGCRHDFIAKYFGESGVVGCNSCDNCTKSGTPNTLSNEHINVLCAIRSLPIRLNKKTIAKALTGAENCPIQPHEWSFFGTFSMLDSESVHQLIDDLIDWGYLERDGTPIRPIITLSAAGRKLIADK